MIHILDYGVGNVQAILNVYKRLGIQAERAKTADDVKGARRLLLPGVGKFDTAMDLFDRSGMRPAVETAVRDGIPLLGICVGMQMLADSSEEGHRPGLGMVPGRVRHFSAQPAATRLPMPHMGWNDVFSAPGVPLFNDPSGDYRFYFLHSFYFEAAEQADVAACAEYGFLFHCAVARGRVFGVQFHPEKSHHWGAGLLQRFAEV
jgi:glutamine amidotransferase